MLALYWWIDRWRHSSAFTDLTLEEQGAYRNLLDECWLRGGGVPNVERTLARASGDPIRWPKLRANVMRRFYLKQRMWRNETLDQVLHQSERRARNQRRYRLAHGNGIDNAVDNAKGHLRGNGRSHKRGN